MKLILFKLEFNLFIALDLVANDTINNRIIGYLLIIRITDWILIVTK